MFLAILSPKGFEVRKKPAKFHAHDYFFETDSSLHKWPTDRPALYSSDESYATRLAELQLTISEQQDKLFADGRHGILVIFQGMDGSGKDSTIKHVFSALNPQGVLVSTFGPPTKEDLAHDFFWRVHKHIGPRGKISVLNRSYYEDVAAVRVFKKYLSNENLPLRKPRHEKFFSERLKSIVGFEKHLLNEGYTLVKFFLNVSKEEQARRLLARINDPKKNWKFDPSDLRDRDVWSKFQIAYSEAMQETSTKQCPWYIIPADDKKNARLMVAKILAKVFEDLPIEFPESRLSKKQLAEARMKLGSFK
jgi:PPK2 family polyphosphate:nucleotide phosphotransferase